MGDLTKVSNPEGEQDDEGSDIKSVLQDIIKAQAELNDSVGVSNLTKHIKTVLYPILSKSLCTVDTAITEMYSYLEEQPAEEVDSDSIGKENVDFFCGYVDTVFQLIVELGPLARKMKDQGSPGLFASLEGLLRSGAAVKQVVLSLQRPDDK